ncbi:hypothetical protein BSPWISOXPB_8012 [uncultured Gammaproteobacteria bacterium]|nr:hypothetical protein BSPWISOXPB_8012 [uncultured Gammaproteobacteria bacterium]
MQKQLKFQKRQKTNFARTECIFSIDEKSLFQDIYGFQWSMMLSTLFMKKLQKNIS